MKLIVGKFNSSNEMYYWDISHFKDLPNIGDYAIVENKNDYDLVKIIATVNTTEKYRKFLFNKQVSKKALWVIPRNSIRED